MSEPKSILRAAFHQQLAEIDSTVIQLFAMVTDSLAAATDTFLSGDRENALAIAGRDALVDQLNREVQEVVERNLVLEAPVASDLRYLLSVLRIVPEVERSGDLAEHIAKAAARGLGTRIPPKVRGMVEQMGSVGVDMWRAAANAFVERDGGAYVRLDALDDVLDDLHDQLSAELMSGSVPVAEAVEMGLVARYYERLGDHAFHITERIRDMAT